uniref:Uncharacterized protein n=1 Tax=Triticum urartu TaxID=4572 RepID=A0A8R7PGY3_TRIUA
MNLGKEECNTRFLKGRFVNLHLSPRDSLRRVSSLSGFLSEMCSDTTQFHSSAGVGATSPTSHANAPPTSATSPPPQPRALRPPPAPRRPPPAHHILGCFQAQLRSPRDSGSATESRSIDRLVRPLNSARLLHPGTSPAASPSPNRAREGGFLPAVLVVAYRARLPQWGAPRYATGLCPSTSSTPQRGPWSPSGGGSMLTLFPTGSGGLAARWGCHLRQRGS